MSAEKARGPVFIIGTERSGSNLLRLVLNSHSRFAIPHPPHLMRFLDPIGHSYGDLRVTENRRRLIDDALLLCQRHLHPWPAIPRDLVLQRASPSVFGVVAAIYEEYRVLVDKDRWGCKSTFMVNHVDEVLGEYPDARFVLLVRDPCDVAASAKRAVFGHCHPYRMARLWRAEQELGFAALDRYGPEVVHLLRYEDFVSGPEQEIVRLCEFLGESVEPAMLAHQQHSESKRLARLSQSWSTAGQPINTTRIGGHRNGLTERERGQVDLVTADLKHRLGYDADPGSATPPSMLDVVIHSTMLRAQVEFRSLLRDRNHARRWLRDATVRWLRLKAAVRRQMVHRHRRSREGAKA